MVPVRDKGSFDADPIRRRLTYSRFASGEANPMSDLSIFGIEMPHLFAVVELQDLFVGFLILASTIAYLIWLVKRKL